MVKIFCGDDTDSFNDQRLALTFTADGVDLTDCTAEVEFLGQKRTFSTVTDGGSLSFSFSAAETRAMKCGVWPVTIRLLDSNGRVRTVDNTQRIKVTKDVNEAYADAEQELTVALTSGGSLPEIPDTIDAVAADSVGEFKAKFNQLLNLLRGTAAAVAFMLGCTAFGAVADTATLNDVPGNAAIVTNVSFSGLATTAELTAATNDVLDAAAAAVPNIVTNEIITGYTEWTFRTWDESDFQPDNSAWQLEWMDTSWVILYRPADLTDAVWTSMPSGENGTSGMITCTRIVDEETQLAWVDVSRTPIMKNALELARLADLPPLTNGLLTAEADPVWAAQKEQYATTNTTTTLAQNVGTLWSYVYGNSVWIAVTNYMRTVSGVSPSFQLWEVRDGATNLVYWSKEEITNVTSDLIHDCKTNLETTVANAVAEMPQKAWSKYQSATGQDAPDGVTIISTPMIQLTGGGEWYRYVDTSSNSVWLLKSNGLTTMGGDTNGYFRILDDEGNTTFEVRKTDSYLVDAIAESVSFNGNGDFVVSYTANAQPEMHTATSLSGATWYAEGEDANISVAWSNSGGVWTATISQAVRNNALFVYAKVLQQGETAIINTAPTRFDGGILLNGTKYSIVPYTTGGKTYLTLEAQ